jgi:hypothetical protein
MLLSILIRALIKNKNRVLKMLKLRRIMPLPEKKPRKINAHPFTFQNILNRSELNDQTKSLILEKFDEKTILYALRYYKVYKDIGKNINDFVIETCERVYLKRKKRENSGLKYD